jgi:hypothetical protein
MAQTSARIGVTQGLKPPFLANPHHQAVALSEDDLTVEQFLQSQCEAIIRDFQMKTGVMIKKLQSQYEGRCNG